MKMEYLSAYPFPAVPRAATLERFSFEPAKKKYTRLNHRVLARF